MLLISGFLTLNAVARDRTNFEMKKKSIRVVFGHSHPECAFNDTLISNFSNYAASGEAYFYTYLKAKNIIQQNAQIETVFIEFSNDQIGSFTDNWIWTDKYLSKRFDEYAPFMSFKEHRLLFSNNPSGFIKFIITASKKNVKKIANNRMHFNDELGGYRFLEANTSDAIRVNLLKPEKDEIINGQLSETNMSYLKKLINYCTVNSKAVYLIRTPVHESSVELQNETQFKKVLLEQFNNVEFLDFLEYPLKNSDFYDSGHLNSKGAKTFSTWFNSLLENGILNKEKKQEYIDQQIKIITDNS